MTEIEEAVARVERQIGEALTKGSPTAYVSVGDYETLFSALSASQAEVERLTRERDEWKGRAADREHEAEQRARKQWAAEARATRAEGLLAEAGEVLGPFADVAQLLIAEPGVSLSISKGDGTVLVEDSDYHTARAFLAKLKEQG